MKTVKSRVILNVLVVPCLVAMLGGCDSRRDNEKNSQELLAELTRNSREVVTPDEETIASQATRLLSQKREPIDEATARTASPSTEVSTDAVMVIDSVPDKPQQSLPVEDENDSPWMFDPSTPMVSWEVIYQANTPVGYTKKKSTASNRAGEPVVTTEFNSVVRFKKDGSEVRQELSVTSIERPNGEIISLTSKRQSATDSQTLVARVDGARAILELSNNGSKQQTEIGWDKATRGPFAIEQSMMRRPLKDNESRIVRFFDPFSGRVKESRLDAQSKYKSPVMIGKSKMLRESKVLTRAGETLSESTLWSDEDGIILKSYNFVSDTRSFQVDEEKYREMESVFDLSFSANKSMKFTIKPGKREVFLDAIKNDDQITFRFQLQQSDPYRSLSNKCNQRVKSLDAFTSEVTVFRLGSREELPAGVDSLDKPSADDLELVGSMDFSGPVIDELYTELLSQVVADDAHLKVMSFAKRLSERYESVEFNNAIRRLPAALSTNRLNSVEQSLTLVALLRKDRIPARLVIGYVYDRSASEPMMVFHAWVEYHNQNWWWPIDPAYPASTGLLDRIKLKELSRLTVDLRREITKVLELSNSGSITYQD